VTPVELAPDWVTFDVSDVNQQLDKVRGTKRSGLVGGAVLAIAIFLFFLITDLPEIRAGSVSGVRLAALVIVGGFVVLMLHAFLTGFRSVLGGARRVRLNDRRIEVDFRSRRPVATDWADQKLRIDLYDMTGIPSDRMRVPLGYSMHLRGYDVAITPEAYAAVLEECGKHGLEDRVHRGTTWVYSARAAPTIHSIRHPTDSRPKL
jgi:hypothetical protein